MRRPVGPRNLFLKQPECSLRTGPGSPRLLLHLPHMAVEGLGRVHTARVSLEHSFFSAFLTDFPASARLVAYFLSRLIRSTRLVSDFSTAGGHETLTEFHSQSGNREKPLRIRLLPEGLTSLKNMNIPRSVSFWNGDVHPAGGAAFRNCGRFASLMAGRVGNSPSRKPIANERRHHGTHV